VSKLGQFTIQILIYSIKSFLELLLSELAHRVVRGVMVHIGEKNGLGEGWPNVFPGAAVSVSTGSNLAVVVVSLFALSLREKEKLLYSRKNNLLDLVLYRRCLPKR